MKDYIVRAAAKDGSVRAFCAVTTNLVNEAQKIHSLYPVASAALGRLLTASAMMGAMLKSEDDLLTLQITGNGPIGRVLATADCHSNVKGYVGNPEVIIPANAKGKLDVSGAVGNGFLQVIKDMGLKEPYVGQVALQTGEIAEDLTYYFATSEQIPSAVGLGVLVDKDQSVKQAGGFIIQLMPFTPDEVVDRLEKKITEIDSVTQMLDRGLTPEQILEEILGDFGLEITDTTETRFHCDCSKERVSRALSTLSKKDLDSIIADGESIEVKCQFCNKAYEFTVDELKEMR